MVSLRPTQRRVAFVSAFLGFTMLASAGTWAWVRSNEAGAKRTAAIQSTRTLGNDGSSNLTALISQDNDLLQTLARDPSFASWEALPGLNKAKLASNVGASADLRDKIRQGFLDYASMFPDAFQDLQFIDTTNGQPLAVLDRGKWVEAADLPAKSVDAKQSWFSSVSTVGLGQTTVTLPYTDNNGDRVITFAAPLTSLGAHGVILAKVKIAFLFSAVLGAGGGDSSVIGLVNVQDGTALVNDGGRYALTDKAAKVALDRFTAAKGAVDYVVDGRSVSVIPSEGLWASGVDVSWFAVVAEGPLPAAGLAATTNPIIFGLGIVGLVLLLLALFLVLKVRRRSAAQGRLLRAERDRFASGMTELTGALARTSTGDLATRLNVELGDEAMTGLAASFDQTLGALRDLVASAQANSSLLNVAATELRASSTQQATSANQQSAVVTETTATIEELAATAVQIAETSEAVAAIAEQTLATTIEGRGAVEESVAAIEAINLQVGFIAQACEGLGEKISEIGGILAIIDELSDQTNLLALNAAIEAARAGEHGRGFAVVASEIRRLAERSQESTVRIQSIITEISSRARQTVEASAQGSQAVHAVTEQARAAANSLDRIAALVDTTTSAAREISAATGQQRSASEQVVQAMAEVSASARQFAAGAKQSASSAKEIADLAVRTEMSISHFVTEQEDVEDHEGEADGATSSTDHVVGANA